MYWAIKVKARVVNPTNKLVNNALDLLLVRKYAFVDLYTYYLAIVFVIILYLLLYPYNELKLL